MNHLSYAEALIVGAFQGVTELFPVSSLGHSVLVPALIGGRWAQDLNVSTPESPYLAVIVGLHMATAGALLVFFWRDWLAILAGFATSLRYRRIQTPAERLAWLIVLATIPVGISGLALEHLSRTILGKPIPAAVFLTLNGIILYAGERLRRRAAIPAPATADTPAPTDDPPLSLSTPPMTGWPACPCPKGGDRLRPNPCAAARHQPLGHHHGGRSTAWPLPRGRRALLVPAGHPGDPGRRGAQNSRPLRAARGGHRRPHPGRKRRLLHLRVPVGAVSHPLLPHPHPDTIRHLLHPRRHRQHAVADPQLTRSARPRIDRPIPKHPPDTNVVYMRMA